MFLVSVKCSISFMKHVAIANVKAMLAFNPSEPNQTLTNIITTVVQNSLDKVMDDLKYMKEMQ